MNFILLFISFYFASFSASDSPLSLFNEMGLEKQMDYSVFETAYNGMAKFNPDKKDKLVIFDVTKPSTEKRFYVLDLKGKKLLYHCLAAHGKGSGENNANLFSNTPNSMKTAPGFYLTLSTYSGKHGYSLKLRGLEKGINDNAEKRAIVIHGADYVSDDFIKVHGRIGRSWGCPALPVGLSKEIIDCIKDGTLLYIFAGR